MRYFFQDVFIAKVKKLLKNNAYSNCEKALINDVFGLAFDDLIAKCTAYRLNADSNNPIAKLRISHNAGKSSSYRVYVFVIIKDEKMYFAILYPKTGKYKQNSLSSKEETKVIKGLLGEIREQNVKEVYLDKTSDKICYVANKKKVF